MTLATLLRGFSSGLEVCNFVYNVRCYFSLSLCLHSLLWLEHCCAHDATPFLSVAFRQAVWMPKFIEWMLSTATRNHVDC